MMQQTTVQRRQDRLEDIGFYTLSEDRARHVSSCSPLKRCELILTDQCNFRCTYCRGQRYSKNYTMPTDRARAVLDQWAEGQLESVRFSGGEPLMHPQLRDLVQHAKDRGMTNVAISTNGSGDPAVYDQLVDAGVNDFSISLDACCASMAATMSGGSARFERVVENIRHLAQRTYVTAGIVLNEQNIGDLVSIVAFAHDLGVADIRIIPSAQFNAQLVAAQHIAPAIWDQHPILRYRVRNIRAGRHVRGLQAGDTHRCPLVLDDMVVAGDYHFPCVIHMREGGRPIGRVHGKTHRQIRRARHQWYERTDTHQEAICRQNCLDVCIDHNNAVEGYRPSADREESHDSRD